MNGIALQNRLRSRSRGRSRLLDESCGSDYGIVIHDRALSWRWWKDKVVWLWINTGRQVESYPKRAVDL